jgi:hypothetical protein
VAQRILGLAEVKGKLTDGGTYAIFLLTKYLLIALAIVLVLESISIESLFYGQDRLHN